MDGLRERREEGGGRTDREQDRTGKDRRDKETDRMREEVFQYSTVRYSRVLYSRAETSGSIDLTATIVQVRPHTRTALYFIKLLISDILMCIQYTVYGHYSFARRRKGRHHGFLLLLLHIHRRQI